MQIQLVEALDGERNIVWRLLQLYLHDLSEFDNKDVDAQGEYSYLYFDAYWTDSERRPYLIRVDGEWTGLVLVLVGEPHDIAGFFVTRKYRHRGVGKHVARLLFEKISRSLDGAAAGQQSRCHGLLAQGDPLPVPGGTVLGRGRADVRRPSHKPQRRHV